MNNARILIVEDEVIIAMELESQLQSLGYNVTSIVNTGEQALAEAEADKPDLILMDIRIKGEMDGIDAAEVIRNKFGIPVIFSTAYLDQERIERAKITMPFGYVLKPIQERDLRVTLEMALYVAKVESERKKADETLRLEKNRAQHYLDIAGVLLIVLDTDGIVTLINPKGCEIIGHDKEEIIGRSWFDDFLPAEAKKEVKKVFSQIVEGNIEPVEYYENPIVTKDGSQRLIAWHNSVLRANNGEIAGLFSSGEDITERKLANDALKESERRFKAIFNSIPQLLALWKNEGNQIRLHNINSAAVAYSNKKIEEYIGYSLDDFYKDTPWIIDSIKRCFLTQETICDEKRYQFRTTGETTLLSFKFVYVPNDMVMVIAEDVTESVNVAKALKESEARSKSQFQATPIPTFIWEFKNDQFVLSDTNKAAIELTRGKSSEFIGNNAADIYPDRPDIINNLKVCCESEKTIRQATDYIARSTGSDRSIVFTYAYGPPNLVIMHVEDITEKRQTEQALKESKQRQ
ncbi:PAS domain S-box protein [bacterium]|nr:PAS domain S-box protein [bacterium]